MHVTLTPVEIGDAPVLSEEQGRHRFLIQAPPTLEHDPDACVGYWRTNARLRCLTPLGDPEVVHRVFRRIMYLGRPTYVSDDSEPVFFVVGDVSPERRADGLPLQRR